jgi:D-alanyl-D-alanine carboxypeptidase (penicillin-binding protein 5/6)
MISSVLIYAASILVSISLLTSIAPSLQPEQSLAIPATNNPASYHLPPLAAATNTEEPSLDAAAVLAYDRRSGQVLFEHNTQTQRPIASITKLATAIAIIHNHRLDEIVTIPQLPPYKPEDEIIGLQPGEQYSIYDLLKALMVNSANDAADALAIIDSGSTQAFSTNMTSLLHDWGIKAVNFNNPSGLVDKGNTASAQAVAQMGLLALQNPALERLANTSSTSITSKAGRAIAVKSTNQLLQNPQFKGIKTGYTPAAGECFIGLASVQGHDIITVVLGSSDRFSETQTLINWIDRTYQWQ